MTWFVKLFKDLTKKEATPKGGFEWYDGSLEEQSDDPVARFQVGDEVNLFNPYFGAYLVEDLTQTPVHYTVLAVKYDKKSEVFRYQLEDLDEWISEDWLRLPVVSSFKRTMDDTDDVNNFLEIMTNMNEIDRLLDVINRGTDEEEAIAKRRLEKLTGGDD